MIPPVVLDSVCVLDTVWFFAAAGALPTVYR